MSARTMDKYDPKVPWLTHDEVAMRVRQLPLDSIVELAKGPVGDDEECRACDVLEGLWRAGCEGSAAAAVLMDWHADLGPSDEFLAVLDKHVLAADLRARGRLAEELRDLHGRLAYTRCSVIYALAEAEELNRLIARERGEG